MGSFQSRLSGVDRDGKGLTERHIELLRVVIQLCDACVFSYLISELRNVSIAIEPFNMKITELPESA